MPTHSFMPKQILVCWFILCCVAHSGWSVSPENWRTSTFEEFSKGETKRVSILNPGEIRLSPSYRLFTKADEPVIWSLIESKDGKTLYLGTGNSAQIHQASLESKDATAEARLFADLDGSAVYAMTLDATGNLYAGVSPTGNVFRILPDGAVSLVGSTKQKYIWGMIFDATGDLILATGDNGQILKMTMSGKVKPVLKTTEKHILSMIKGKDDQIYYGSAPNGWVGVLEKNNKHRVLYDSELSEVKALTMDPEGNLYAGIVPKLQVEPKPDNPQAAQAMAMAGSQKADRSSEIVKVTSQGVVQVLTKTDNATLNTMTFSQVGLLAGTGDKGLLYHLGYRQQLDLVTDLDATDILALSPRSQGGTWIATGNPAEVYMMPVGTNDGGIYASEPLDAQLSSEWGTMTWKASIPQDATLDFQTRSGNTEEPDENWSEWSAPRITPGKVTSPIGRFLQWRARFGGSPSGSSAVIQEVEIIYQKLNQAPRILTVQSGDSSTSSTTGTSTSSQTTSGDSTASSSGSGATTKTNTASSSSPQVRRSPSNAINLAWKTEDKNGDDLIYDLEYRMVGETLWKKIEYDLKAPKYTWNLTAYPDGEYEIRISVSDKGSNPPTTALTDTWITEPLRVDTNPPRVVEWGEEKISAGNYELKVVMEDKVSRLNAAEVVIDGEEDKAQSLLPEDQILDTNRETFLLKFEGLKSGEHSLTIRARDEMGNIGSDSRMFVIP